MKVGDLVTDDFYEDVGLVVSIPRLPGDCDSKTLGIMRGDVHTVVDVLCTDGNVRLFTTDELRVINESR